MTNSASSTGTDTSRSTIALGFSGLGLVLFVLAMLVAQERNDWLWPVAGVIGLIGAIIGWTAGRPRPSGKAMGAVVVGGLVFLVVFGWWLVTTLTGNA